MDFDFKEPNLSILLSLKKDTKQLLEYMLANEMAPLYFHMVKSNKIMVEEEIHKKFLEIAEINKQKIKILQDQKAENSENASHIFEIDKKISTYLASICDYEKFVSLTRVLIDINHFFSLRMDVFLCRTRISMIIGDSKETEKNIKICSSICEEGCDWDRKNKFKLYNALYLFMKRQYSESAELFCDALSTYSSKEFLSYEHAVLFAIFTVLLKFDRDEIEKKIVSNSNILEVKSAVEKAYNLAVSILNCNYASVFVELAVFIDSVSDDVFLKRHLNHFCREMKLNIYSQLLKSYESLSLEYMAKIFGLSVEFIENDLCDFIAKDRLSCKIDSVNMTVSITEKKCNENMKFIELGDEIVRMIKKNMK